MRTSLARSIPFSGVRFILYAMPIGGRVASYKDNPGWREPARQKARHRQRVCGILEMVATPSATTRCLAGFGFGGAFVCVRSRGFYWRLRDHSTMVLFGLSQPHQYSGLR